MVRCPKCKSVKVIQLGVNANYHSDLVCLDCDWDNMSELVIRKPVLPGICRSDRDGDFLHFRCLECQREYIDIEAQRHILECGCGMNWLIISDMQYGWCYERVPRMTTEELQEIFGNIRLHGNGEPYRISADPTSGNSECVWRDGRMETRSRTYRCVRFVGDREVHADEI